MKRTLYVSFVVLVLAMVACLWTRGPAPARSADRRRPRPAPGEAAARIVEQPLHFAPNRGQAPPDVLFVSSGARVDLRLDRSGASLALNGRDGSRTLRLRFDGASPSPAVSAERELAGRMNYISGHDPSKWIHDVPTYGRVRYAGIYPGVDAVYYGNQRRLEYDFVVAPGADPRAIRLAFDGADRLAIGDSGGLRVYAGGRYLEENAPVMYQQRNGRREAVTGRFRLDGARRVSIDVDAYDAALPLVIDPLVLGWSSYFGGEGNDFIDAAAVNSKGEMIVAGTMSSSNWPVTRVPGYFSIGGGRDVFVSRFAKDGSHLSTTMLGGENDDRAAAIAVDPNDNIYVTGSTQSLLFPTTANAVMPESESLQVTFGIGPIKFPKINTAPASDADAFVTRLDPTGATVVYSTYLGGSPQVSATLKQKTTNPTKLEIEFEANPGLDYGTGIAADANGNAYVVGATDSDAFPVTDDAVKTDLNGFLGASDGFIAKIDTNGSGSDSLKYSSYLGGSCNDIATGVAIDGKGHVYITGDTDSPAICGGFATTTGSANPNFIGSIKDGWVIGMILDPALNPTPGVFFSTFIGVNDANHGGKVGVDAYGSVYATYTAGTDLSTQTLHLVKLSRDGTQQLWDKSLGSTVSGWDSPSLLQGSFFPHGLFVTPYALNIPIFALRNDGSNGPELEQVTNIDTGAIAENSLNLQQGNLVSGLAADADSVYVAGATSVGTLPVTPGAVQGSPAGGLDGFVASVVYNQPPVITPQPVGPITEGTNFTGPVASFVNPSTVPSNFSVTINWGDGSPTDVQGPPTDLGFRPFISPNSTGGFIIGIHTYSDWGTYPGQVCLLRQADSLTTCAPFIATIADDPPQVTVVNQTVAPGAPGVAYAPSGTSANGFLLSLNAVATFADAGVHDSHTATINWGDGVTTPVAIGQGQRSLPNVSHVYSLDPASTPSTESATVCVKDRAGNSDCKPFTVEIPKADLAALLSGPATASECAQPTYQLTVRNSSGSSIDNVTVTATLSDTADASFTSATFLGASGGAAASSFATQLPVTFPPYPGAPNQTLEGQFGGSMAISGNTAVVGSNFGSAHVYEFDTGTLQWSYRGELDGGSETGRSAPHGTTDVAIDGDTIVRGDGDAQPGSTGFAAVYQRVNGAWTLAQELAPHNPYQGNGFGYRVQIHGSTLAMSGDDGVYIFAKQNDGSWAEAQHVAGAGIPAIGFTDDGGTMFLGFPGDPQVYPPNQNAASQGTVWRYTLVNGQWTFQDKVVAGPQGLPPNVNIADTQGHREFFGASLATHGDWLIVGAPDHTENTAIGFVGAVYTFKRVNGVWTQMQKLLPSNPSAAEFFGIKVSMSGDLLAIGTGQLAGCGTPCGDGEANEAYLFQNTNDAWSQISLIKPGFVGGTDGFGQAVAIDSGKLLVGAPGKAPFGLSGFEGAAYAFGSCLQTQPGTLSCNIGRMNVGDSVTFGVGVSMGASVVSGPVSSASAPITVTASVAGGGLDTETSNNRASVTTSVRNTATDCKDTTPPIIAASVQGTKGQNDWYVSNVSLSWLVADAESAFTTQGCDPATLAADTSGTSFLCSAQSAGGASSVSSTIRIDTKPPTLTYTLAPLAGSPTLFTATFVCQDSGSGVATCPTSTPVSAGSAATFTAVDFAGNTASVTLDIPSAFTPGSLMVSAAPGACSANVMLPGSVGDPGGTPTSITWTENDMPIGSGATPTVTLSAGLHHLILTVTSASGAIMSAPLDVTVNVPPVTLGGGVDQIAVDATGPTTPVTVPQPAATGCGVTMTSNLPANGFPAGTSTVLFTATDVFSRSATRATIVTVTPHVDAGVTIPAATIVAGATSTYVFDVSNAGPSPATRIDVVQQLPAGVTAVPTDSGQQVCGLDASSQQTCVPIQVLSQDAACAAAAGGVKCSIFNVAPNESRPIHLSLATSGSFARGGQTVSATLTSAEADGNSANDSASGTLTVTGSADLALSFVAPAPTDVLAGSTSGFQLAVTNDGVSDSLGFTLSAPLAGGVSILTAPTGCTATATLLTCASGSLPVGQQAIYSGVLGIDPSARGTATFAPTVTGLDPDPAPANNSVTEQATIHVDVHTSAVFAGGPQNVAAGTSTILTALFANTGASAATGASATVQLSPGDFSVTQAPPGCAIVPGNHGFACAIGTIAPGGVPVSWPFQVAVGPFARGSLAATVTLSDADEPATHSASQAMAIVASTSVTVGLSASPDPAVAGTPLSYTLRVSNAGPSGATGVTATMTAPDGTTPATLPAGCTVAQQIVSCTLADLAPQSHADLTIVTNVDQFARGVNGALTATAGAHAAETTPDGSASLVTPLTARADASVTVTSAPNPIVAGSFLKYTITVSNAGPSGAIGATLTHTLSNGVVYISGTGTGASCSFAHGIATCSLPKIPGGGSTVVTIVAVPSVAGRMPSTSTVTVVEDDPDLSNNSASSSATVTSPAAGAGGLGDFNGDGALDLAVSDPHHDIVHIFLNDGQGHFVEHQQVPVGHKPAGLALGDVENDGDLDIVVADQGSDAVSILRNDGTGTFVESARLLTLGQQPVQVALGDFDGDGRLDIATVNFQSDDVSLLSRTADGTWQVKRRLPVAPTGPRGERLCGHGAHNPETIAVGDLNGDGTLDIVVGNNAPDSVSVLLNGGGWQFAPASETRLQYTDDPVGLAVADFNGDGTLDVAVAGKDHGRLSLLFNVNGALVETLVTGPMEDRPVAIAAGDLNGDGQIDLVVAAADDAAMLLNQGGAFPAQTSTNIEVSQKTAIALMVGDINGDGTLDIVMIDDKVTVRIWTVNR